MRIAPFHRVAKPVQGANPRIAAPRKDQTIRAPHADHLVKNQVGRHADEGKVFLSLADDFVAGRKGDQMGKPFQRHGVSVVNQRFHGFGERGTVSRN